MITAREARNVMKDVCKGQQKVIDRFIMDKEDMFNQKTKEALFNGLGFASIDWTYDTLEKTGITDRDMLFKSLEKYFTSLGYKFAKWDIVSEWAAPKVRIQWIWR